MMASRNPLIVVPQLKTRTPGVSNGSDVRYFIEKHTFHGFGSK